MSWLAPVELKGDVVALRPLQPSDRGALLDAAADGELWKLWFTSVPSAQTVDQYLAAAFAQQQAGASLPLCVIDAATGKVIGSTRYCNIETEHQRAEIGYTWYAQSFQRTAANTECKLLLLSHAFDQCDAIAMEFRTHSLNHRSRTAIERLGAKLDGVLRNHRIEAGGAFRDSAVYSIVRDEWPAVKNGLLAKLG
jgi:N-acetyltransferase